MASSNPTSGYNGRIIRRAPQEEMTIKVSNIKNATFEFSINDAHYLINQYVMEGEVSYIFKGTSDSGVIYLKMVIDPNDNKLIDDEYGVLSSLRHHSLPYVEQSVKINNSKAIIMREIKGILMTELFDEYPSGVPVEHVMWILERLLSVVGYLHSKCIVHGNIKPENIIVNKDNHNVSLVGFSFCIPKANTENAKYRIINDFYTAPEVNKNAKVLPCSDIYSVGKIAIALLGGDIATDEMPISINGRIQSFIQKMVAVSPDDRANDAWELWSELSKLRTEVFGTQRFKKLN